MLLINIPIPSRGAMEEQMVIFAGFGIKTVLLLGSN